MKILKEAIYDNLKVGSVVHMKADSSFDIQEGDYTIVGLPVSRGGEGGEHDDEAYVLQAPTGEEMEFDEHYLFNKGYWANSPKTLSHSFTVKENKKMENKKTTQQIREAKIAKIKALVSQIQKVTGKKVIFEDAAPTIEKKFDTVSDANGSRTIESWVSKMPKGEAPNVSAESLLKALKSSGFTITKSPETEKEPTKVTDSKKPVAEAKKVTKKK